MNQPAITQPIHHPEIKRLGAYLIEAGLITPGQVDVALNDQAFMQDDRMRFGDVLVARGWVKQQTLDYLMTKVVEPEQSLARRVVLEESMLVRQTVPSSIPTDRQSIPQPSSTRIADRSSPGRPPIGPATASRQILGQAVSLDGDTVFQIVLPSRPADIAGELKVDPQLVNERKSLASVDETQDGLNWVG